MANTFHKKTFRIWGKELKGTALSGVCWSPDSRLLLFSMANGEVHVYDGMGSLVSKLDIQCLANMASQVLALIFPFKIAVDHKTPLQVIPY